jgi:hypothetical protein
MQPAEVVPVVVDRHCLCTAVAEDCLDFEHKNNIQNAVVALQSLRKTLYFEYHNAGVF